MADRTKIEWTRGDDNRPQTSFFIDKHGNASRRDPNQPEIPGVTNITREA